MMLIVMHKDLDGFVSAMIVMSAYKTCKVLPVSYSRNRDVEIREAVAGHRDVYFVDVSFDNGELEWAKDVEDKNWIWIDHHGSSLAFNNKDVFNEVLIDTNVSASEAVFRYFNDKGLLNGNNVKILKTWAEIATDRDLWKVEKYELGLDLDIVVRSMLNYDNLPRKLLELSTMSPELVRIVYQDQIYRGRQRLAESCKLANATKTKIGRFVFAYTLGWASDVCQYLRSKDNGEGNVYVLIYMLSPDVVISMRSYAEDIDLSQIASKVFNGGGHKNSAGGTLSGDLIKNGFRVIYECIVEAMGDKQDG